MSTKWDNMFKALIVSFQELSLFDRGIGPILECKKNTLLYH